MSPGYRALREHAAWFSISDRARLRLTGDDRIRLLHALATNDIDVLGPGQATETFFLSPQGRILARCRVYVSADSVLLETDESSRQPLLDYLDRYIIMDDVTVSDVTDSTEAVAIEGPQAKRVLTAEMAVMGTVRDSSLTGAGGVWIELELESASGLHGLLKAASVVEASQDDREAVRVENGIPVHGVDYTNSNIPHETQLLDIVSFEKGCYIGQEIVERVKSQGQVNRLLSPIELDTGEIPTDLEVHLGDRTVGQVTSPIVSPQTGKVRGFAILRRVAFAPESELTVGGQTTHVLPGRDILTR